MYLASSVDLTRQRRLHPVDLGLYGAWVDGCLNSVMFSRKHRYYDEEKGGEIRFFSPNKVPLLQNTCVSCLLVSSGSVMWERQGQLACPGFEMLCSSCSTQSCL